jgi:hypothetical protein
MYLKITYEVIEMIYLVIGFVALVVLVVTVYIVLSDDVILRRVMYVGYFLACVVEVIVL